MNEANVGYTNEEKIKRFISAMFMQLAIFVCILLACTQENKWAAMTLIGVGILTGIMTIIHLICLSLPIKKLAEKIVNTKIVESYTSPTSTVTRVIARSFTILEMGIFAITGWYIFLVLWAVAELFQILYVRKMQLAITEAEISAEVEGLLQAELDKDLAEKTDEEETKQEDDFPSWEERNRQLHDETNEIAKEAALTNDQVAINTLFHNLEMWDNRVTKVDEEIKELGLTEGAEYDALMERRKDAAEEFQAIIIDLQRAGAIVKDDNESTQ